MKAKLIKKSNLKYSNIQFLHNVLQCTINAYATIFLKFKGFTNTEVGIAIALAAIISIILQPAIASFADRTSKFSLRQIALLLIGISLFLGFVMLFGNNIKLVIFLTYIPITALQSALSAITNSLAAEVINKGIPLNFGLARGIGSLGFSLTSMFLGFLIGISNPNVLIYIIIIVFFLEFTSIYFFEFKAEYSQDLSASALTAEDSEDSSPTTSLQFLKKYKQFTMLLLGIVLIFYSYNLINIYLINVFENVGGNDQNMGMGLAIGAFLELPVMALFVVLLRKFKCSSMLKFSAIFYFIKALITFLAPSINIIYFAQSLQLFSFALFTPASLYYANMVISRQDSVKGQTMINVASFGLASVIASFTGGIIQDTLGVSAMLLIGTIVTGIGVLIILAATEDTDHLHSKN